MVSKGNEGDRAMHAMQCDPTAEANTISYMVKAKGTTFMGAGDPLKGLCEKGKSFCLLQLRLGDCEA